MEADGKNGNNNSVSFERKQLIPNESIVAPNTGVNVNDEFEEQSACEISMAVECEEDHIEPGKDAKRPCSPMYTCGGCDLLFQTAYHLHDHLQEHIEGGSYYYNHNLRTAYPKYDTFCRMVQTDLDDCARTSDLNIVQTGENDTRNIDFTDSSERNIFVEVKHEQNAGEDGDIQAEFLMSPYTSDKETTGLHEKESAIPISNVEAPIIRRKQHLQAPGKPSKAVENKCIPEVTNLCGVCGKKFKLGKYLVKHVRKTHKSEDQQFPSNNQAGKNCSEHIVQFPRPAKRLKHSKNGVDPRVITLEEKDFDEKVKRNEKDTDEVVSVSEDCVSDDSGIRRKKTVRSVRKVPASSPRKYMKKNKTLSQCEECGITVPQYKMEVHSRVHTGDRPYTCELCGKGLISEVKLRRHLLIHSGSRPHMCTECGATFSVRNKLQVHMNSHLGIKPYLCPICGAEFSLGTNLTRHIKCIHVGNKCFDCEKCDSKFVRKSQLATHLLSHTSERTQTCRYCGKQFKYQQGLRRHEKLHTMPESSIHVCDACGHSFSRKENLERHKQVHLESNLKCYFCSRKFRNQKNLLQHERQHRGEVVHENAELLVNEEQCETAKYTIVSVEVPVPILIAPKSGPEVIKLC